MRSRESTLALKAELLGEIKQLERVLVHNTTAWERIEAGANDYVDWGALALTLHTAYGVMESYFLRISKYFENNLPPERWHKALVEKMSLDIPGLRPPLLTSEGIKDQVGALLKFRHRVRSLYGEDIDPAKTKSIQETAMQLFPSFVRAHTEFIVKLESISREL
jgi:hypothetical protein